MCLFLFFFLKKKKKVSHFQKPTGEKKLQRNEKVILTFVCCEDVYGSEAIKCLHAGSMEM